MSLYQGRALQKGEPRRRGGRVRRVVELLVAFLAIVALVHVPWEGLRRRFAVVRDIRVEGLRYLDASRVLTVAGVKRGDDLIALDLARARQRLLLDSRVALAELHRLGLCGVEVRIAERVPVLRVEHGVPW